MTKKTLLVTGGAGFIGSAVVRQLINHSDYHVVNIDKLTYAGNLESLKEISDNSRYSFEQVDIGDKENISRIFKLYQPVGILHLAAESHVDRSISGPGEFIMTNIVGSYNLLECAREYYNSLTDKTQFKFVHISTDEVFGSLGDSGYFREDTAYDPRSPYSASKASSDLLVRAWYHTYDLPVVITNCTNNYGPYHFPEKLIPLVINNALQGKALPIYGKGDNIRDWLYVDDHAKGIILAFEKGQLGESYCIGGHNERTNLEVVQTICRLLDELQPRNDGQSYLEQISYVSDRAGHDYRYAMDPTKIQSELGWQPEENFDTGIQKTIQWYLDNQQWVNHVLSGEYQNWINLNYTRRL
ncbi:MAG: dTDP-glucose 4,6-dehydratase [Burkholderiales bacterium]|jgi:dTDP-glucose 4,6-dehydratase|nr:dTDP-glucose 4,6-dehydratase [Burkholderiales bacterium]